MDVNERNFRKALGSFASGVTVVTALTSDNRPAGVTVSSFSSLSLNPPLVLFCLNKHTADIEAYGIGQNFVVNILNESQREISIRFANRGAEKWQSFNYNLWDDNWPPIIPNCLASIGCVTEAVHDGGDHDIFIGRVERIEYAISGQPLVHFRGAYM